MRRLAIVLGMTAALAAATAAPAAAHTISPTDFDFGTFRLSAGSPPQQFAFTAVGSPVDADPRISGGDEGLFRTSADTSVPSTSQCGNGNTDPGETCFFRVSFSGSDTPGLFRADVSVDILDGPTAAVTAAASANPGGGPGKGKKKKCGKKKGKGKSAAAAKKKKCKKKGKK
jgi:hypothetical protein